MSAAFFIKTKGNKIFKASGIVCLFAFILSTLSYGSLLQSATRVYLQSAFYYLALDTSHVEVGAYDVYNDGGAGYLLADGERECIVYSVYFSQTEADKVLKALSSQGKQVLLLKKSTPTLCFVTYTEKAFSQVAVGALNSYFGCIQVLSQEISRLDKGATQQSSKQVLQTRERHLAYLGAAYKEEYPTFSTQCVISAEEVGGILKGIVYTNDLRFLLCEWVERYLFLASDFSL